MMLWNPGGQTRFFTPARSLLWEVFERPFPPALPRELGAEAPPLDVHSNDDALFVRALLPGVRAEDLSLRVEDDSLILEGAWRAGAPEGALVRRAELPRGKFTRTVRLPFEVDRENVKARLARGVLEIELPRALSHRPIKIQVAEPKALETENRS